MFSPPELDVANGCESKLSLHGKQTHRDRRSSSRVTDARVGWCVQSGTDPRTQRGGPNSEEGGSRPVYSRGGAVSGSGPEGGSPGGATFSQNKKGGDYRRVHQE